MVIVSHDREFLDNLCTKIVETERGVASTYKGNYTAYVAAKAEREALQWAAYERQQKEIDKLQDLVRRLAGACGVKGGGCTGRQQAWKQDWLSGSSSGSGEQCFSARMQSGCTVSATVGLQGLGLYGRIFTVSTMLMPCTRACCAPRRWCSERPCCCC
jgi:hypothetical protein